MVTAGSIRQPPAGLSIGYDNWSFATAVVLRGMLHGGATLDRATAADRKPKWLSKRRAPYRSGECRDWRKVKTIAWREANRERWRLFERGAR